VDSGKFVTASGISAGTDMALALVARLYGEARAEEIAKRAEYRWSRNPQDDPFAAE
jgi:transcriptional regulator GlxA family with amidase domain